MAFSIWFYVAALCYSVVTIPALSLVVLACRPFIGARRAMRLFRRCIKIYGRGIVSLLPLPCIRVRYSDLSGGNEKEPFIFICNHRSASDPFLMSLLPAAEIVQVVNTWPFHLPVLGLFARWAGYLNVRKMPFVEFKARVGRYIGESVSIAAFPEGTRSASRHMGPFHGALFRACLSFGGTIVPVCIMGNEDKPRRGSLKLHPGVIRVHRLPGLPYEAYRHMTSFALKQRVRGMIQQHLRATEGDGHDLEQGPSHCLSSP